MPFVSDLDQFLQNFDKKNPQKSKSQKAVMEKTSRIFDLRDYKSTEKKESSAENTKTQTARVFKDKA